VLHFVFFCLFCVRSVKHACDHIAVASLVKCS
jgi:hypothetical protein